VWCLCCVERVEILNIGHLKAFIEVANTRSLSLAAKKLLCTKTTLQNQLQSLEDQLSVALFTHNRQSMELTEAGRVLLLSARKICAELSRIEDGIANIGKTVDGTLTIGTTEYIGTHHLAPVLARYRTQYPDVNIDLHFLKTEVLLESTNNALFDIALCPLHDNSISELSPSLRYRNVWSYGLQVVVANSAPLAVQSNVSIGDLLRTTAILPPALTIARRAIDKCLIIDRPRGYKTIEAENFDTMKSLASIGLGWTCLPHFEIDEQLTVLDDVQLNLHHHVALVHRTNMDFSRASLAFIDMLPSGDSPANGSL